MRKQITVFIFVFLMFSTTAKAFFPLAFPAIPTALYYVSAAAHAALLAGLAYYMKSGASSRVDSSGTVSRPANATYIDLKLPTPAVVTKDISSKISLTQMQALAAKVDTTGAKLYPLSYAALYIATANQLSINSKVGDVVNTPIGNKTITSFSTPYNWGTNAQADGVIGSCSTGGNYCNMNLGPDSYSPGRVAFKQAYFAAETPYIPPRPRTLAEALPALAASGTSGPVKTALQSEMDKMMQDPDYVPTFTDDTTGLPYAPPAADHVATPAQVATYNANGQATASAQQAAASSSAAAGSAQSASDNAKNAYAASGGDPATGTGGDASLYQKYLDAKSAADKAAADAAAAQSAADKLAAEQAAQQDTDTDNSTYSGTFDSSTPYGDQSKDFNFGTRFQTFINQMKNTAIFSLPNQFLANIPSSSTSTMSFSGGRFGQFTYDFAQFNGVFAVLKAIVLVLFGWVSIKIVLLKGGSQ